MGTLNNNSGTIGYIIIGIFIVSWTVSLLVYRTKRYDEIDPALLTQLSTRENVNPQFGSP
jgi:hypothetical protein